MLNYKMRRTGSSPTLADRWYPSSQIHHGCGCRLYAPRKLAKQLACVVTGEVVDRDHNAAKNLRDWPESNVSSGPVGSSVPVDTQARLMAGTDPGLEDKFTCPRRSGHKTKAKVMAPCGEAETLPRKGMSLE